MPNSFPSPPKFFNDYLFPFVLMKGVWSEYFGGFTFAKPIEKFIDKEKSLHEFMDLSTTILRERETRGLDVFWGHQPTRSSLWTKIIFPVIAWLKLRKGRYLEPDDPWHRGNCFTKHFDFQNGWKLLWKFLVLLQK
jgi:hypothetical protein